MHRILLRSVVLDFAPEDHAAGTQFWQLALDATTDPAEHPEFRILRHPAAIGLVLTQQLGAGPSRVHLDLESDDLHAEVTRLCGAGAQLVARHHDWVVLRDPAGMLFCVVPPVTMEFATLARIVE